MTVAVTIFYLESRDLFHRTGISQPAHVPLTVHDRTDAHVAHPHPLTGSPAAERKTNIQMPVVGLEAWFTQIPPVTRTWLALSVLTSVAVVRSDSRILIKTDSSISLFFSLSLATAPGLMGRV